MRFRGPIDTINTLFRAIRTFDPRYYQMAAIGLLLAYGIVVLDFGIRPDIAATYIVVSQLVQFVGTRVARLPRFDPRSALISSMSLTLLLRTESMPLAAVAAVIAMGSKFVFRWNDKHVFNPVCFGIVAMIALSDRVWVSAGQWGSVAFFGFLLTCIGGIVVSRAARTDVTFAFLACYATILFGRAFWLGDPPAIPVHQLQNGALLLFAFFMISDPKTTPNSRPGRVVFAALVAAGACFVQFGLYRTNGLFWSLTIANLTIPLFDRLLPGMRYVWNAKTPENEPITTKGESHEIETDHPGHLPEPAV